MSLRKTVTSRELNKLRSRLEDSQEVLRAIRMGEVDAFVVSGVEGDRVYVLEGAEHPYRVFVETMNEGAATLLRDGTIVYSNARLAQMMGAPLEKVIGARLPFFVAFDHQDRLRALLDQALAGPSTGTVLLRNGSGTSARVELSMCPVTLEQGTGICLIASDSNEKALSAALKATETLLREVHHRVKNNLQIISSLLSMQAEGLGEGAQKALEEVQLRVRSMALVHEQLYGRERPDDLDFAEYASSLTTELLAAYGRNSGTISPRFELEPVLLGIDQAIPCGLILNELVTNSLKYAFPGDRTGEILVALHCDQEQRVTLRVADNGVGLPPGFDWQNAQSLGLRIVNILAAQLNGTLDLAPGTGADFTLAFSMPRRAERHVRP